MKTLSWVKVDVREVEELQARYDSALLEGMARAGG